MRIAGGIVALLLAGLGLVGCATPFRCAETVVELQQVPRLGDRLPDLKETCTQTMAASAQTWPSYQAVVDGTSFTVGVDEGAVRFIAVTDPSFAPPEGLRIGDPVAAAVAAAPGAGVIHEPGWGHYVALPSGWQAFIDDARITMFFMRD